MAATAYFQQSKADKIITRMCRLQAGQVCMSSHVYSMPSFTNKAFFGSRRFSAVSSSEPQDWHGVAVDHHGMGSQWATLLPPSAAHSGSC